MPVSRAYQMARRVASSSAMSGLASVHALRSLRPSAMYFALSPWMIDMFSAWTIIIAG